MGILKKIQMLKRGLMALICINILVLSTSLFATYNYYCAQNQLEAEWKSKQQNIEQLSAVESELIRLTLAQPKSVDEIYEYRRDSDKLKSDLRKISDPGLEQLDYLKNSKDWKFNTTLVQPVANRIQTLKLDQQKAATQLLNQTMKASFQASVAGGLTFFFGIVLPLLISYFITRALLEAKKTYEQMVAEWMTKYLAQWRGAGDKPFQDPFFWMNIVIVTVEIFGPQSKHPAMQILSEFAPVIKKEINKKQAA